MASNMHYRGVADRHQRPGSFGIDKESTGVAASQRLIAEANHAAGNLIHRLHYLVGMLEDDPSANESAEAIAQIKDSLGQLHQLVNDTMGLLRPVALRPIRLRLADVVESIALRFGCALPRPSSETQEWSDLELDCDPSQLDRALVLLASRLSGSAESFPTGRAAGATLRVESSRRRGAHITGVTVCLERSCVTQRDQTIDAVASQLGLAMATRLFALLGWSLELREHDAKAVMSIFVPVFASADASLRPAHIPL